ncbi:transglutaminase family protein [Sessilibacter corallicola]|uniref:Transglutaminase family protein n=1 Tax=Sessilibacter corallicola TaxID=2904075 RepID=A0ABQ0A620_9GAMM|nr:transglutaminase family protein [Sessilibacter corallicola]MCE2027810.1 transglutaminase family protein [Sessilibacter corallicola]
MLYRIRHITQYRYASPVSLAYNLACLLPRNTEYQTCLDHHLTISPNASALAQRKDYFGNNTHNFCLETAHKELTVDIASTVRIADVRLLGMDLEIGSSWEFLLEQMHESKDEMTLRAREFCLDSNIVRTSQELREYAEPSFTPGRPLLSAVRDLNHRIFTDFAYDPGFTTVSTPLTEVLQHRRGVCQDFAHLAIGCLRSMGFASRYVSGYLETLPPPGEEKLVGSDASHAWFSVYAPGEGWFEFDPTNDNMPSVQHITTAWGRDYADVSPLKGVIFEGGGSQTLSVSVDVQRLEN